MADKDRKKVSFHLNHDTYIAFRKMGLDLGQNIQVQMEQAVNEYMAKNAGAAK